jgi:hypothetical protein
MTFAPELLTLCSADTNPPIVGERIAVFRLRGYGLSESCEDLLRAAIVDRGPNVPRKFKSIELRGEGRAD